MKYDIKNTARVGKSYEAGNGKRIHFEAGEEKRLSTPPPNTRGWEVEEIEEETKSSDKDTEEVN